MDWKTPVLQGVAGMLAALIAAGAAYMSGVDAEFIYRVISAMFG